MLVGALRWATLPVSIITPMHPEADAPCGPMALLTIALLTTALFTMALLSTAPWPCLLQVAMYCTVALLTTGDAHPNPNQVMLTVC